MKLIRSQFLRSLFASSALRFVSNPPKRMAEKEGRRGGCREGGAERRNGRNYGGSKRWKRKRARERRIHRAAITKCLAQRERERELSCIDMRSRVFLVYSNYICTITSVLRSQFDGGVGSEALQVLRGQSDQVVGVLLQVSDGVVLKEHDNVMLLTTNCDTAVTKMI